ncbi:DUF2207 domain-containing protein [soil metagenome]
MFRATFALLICACVFGTPVAAAERRIEFRELVSSIVVLRDGSIRVTERLTVHFEGEWNGVYRTIPVEYLTNQQLRYRLRLDVVSVTDDAGTELRHDVANEGPNRKIRIWVPGANNATRTVVLTYASPNALRFFDEHDELYWNVTGDAWDFPIQRTRAEVVLPDGVTGVRSASFAGPAGSSQPGTAAQQIGNALYFETDQPLGYRDGLTIVVGWNPGVVHRPTATQKAGALVAANSILLLPLIAFFAMLGLWRRFGRDPDAGSIYVRYEPPPDMTPAEAGTLIDDRPDLRDITATLVDLAVRGYAEINEQQSEQLFGLIKTRDYEIVLLQAERWPALKPHERALLQALSVHAHNDRVLLSELQNEFYKHLPAIRKHLNRTLIDGGHYRRHPNHVRAMWIVIAIVTTFAVAMAGGALALRYHISPVASVIASALTFLVMAVFGLLMPRRTALGAQTHAWLRGFQEFLDRVEKDRLQRIDTTAATFEKYLPYAMAFGVEKNWARAFQDMATTPPSWYHGAQNGPFRTSMFVADLGRMTGAAGSAMSSAPRSSGSGSSGFSGGSSGGGFGGGGGGGF